MPRTKKVKVVEQSVEPIVETEAEPEPNCNSACGREGLKGDVSPFEEPIQKPKKGKAVILDESKIQKQKLFQEKKQNKLNSLVEKRALELLQQKEKDEEPVIDEEVIIVKKNRKPKQKKVVYIEEDEEIEDYVYKQTKPSVPIQVRYW